MAISWSRLLRNNARRVLGCRHRTYRLIQVGIERFTDAIKSSHAFGLQDAKQPSMNRIHSLDEGRGLIAHVLHGALKIVDDLQQ